MKNLLLPETSNEVLIINPERFIDRRYAFRQYVVRKGAVIYIKEPIYSSAEKRIYTRIGAGLEVTKNIKDFDKE
jgi:hypothetical protein